MTTDQPKHVSVWQRFWPLICALGAALFFAACQPTLGVKSLWIDEMRTGYATLTGGALDMSLMRYIMLNDPVGPLYDLLVAGFCKIFGNSDVMLRLPSLAFMALSVAAFGILARRFLSTGASFLCLLLYMVSMNTLYFAQEARPYAMLLCWALLTYLLVTLEPHNPRRRWGLFALAFSIGMYVHIVFAFVIANCVLYEWLFVRRKKNANGTKKAESPANGGDRDPRSAILMFWQNLSPVTSGAIIAALVYLPWFIILITKSADPARTPDVTHSLGKTVLVTLSGLLIGNAYAPMKIMSMAAAAAILMWLYGLARFRTHRPRGRGIVLLWTFAPMLLTFTAFTLLRNVYNFFHFRYLLPVMPFLLLPMGAGLHAFIDDNIFGFFRRKGESLPERVADIWLRPANLPKFIYLFIILILLFGNTMNYLAYQNTKYQDWRGAHEYVTREARPGDTIILYGIASPMMAYYHSREGIASSKRSTSFTIREANNISDIYDAFSSNPYARLVFYEDHWHPEIDSPEHRWFKVLCKNKTVFPGHLGDVTICSSSNPMLLKTLSVCFESNPERDLNSFQLSRNSKSDPFIKAFCPDKSCEAHFTNPETGTISLAITEPLPAALSILSNQKTPLLSFPKNERVYLSTMLPQGDFNIKLHNENDSFGPVCVDFIRRNGMELPSNKEKNRGAMQWIRK